MAKSQIKSGVILSYIIIIANTVVGLLLTPFLLRELGQNEYGLYTLIGSFSSYMMLMDFGTTTTTVRYIAKYRSENNFQKIEKFIGTILSFYATTGILITVIGIIIYYNLESIFSSSISYSQLPEAKTMFIFVIINSAIVMLMHALPAIITAYEKFTFSKSVELIRIILRMFFIYVFIKVGGSAVTIIIIDTILNLFLTILRIYYVTVKLNIKLKFTKLDINFVKEVGQYSFFIFLASIINQVNVRADQLILGIVSSTEQVAISGVSSKLNHYYSSFAGAITSVFLPRVTAMITRNKPITEIENFTIKIGKLQGKLLILIATGFIAVGQQFILLWAGEGYEVVYIIVIILMISNLSAYTQGILLSVTQAMNKHKERNIIYLFVTIFNVIITIPLANRHGALGAAIATGISMFIGYYILIQIYYKKVIGINIVRFFYETIIKALPSSCISLFVVYIANNFLNNGIFDFIVKIIIVIVTYIISIWFIDFTSFEKDITQKILRKIVSKIKNIK